MAPAQGWHAQFENVSLFVWGLSLGDFPWSPKEKVPPLKGKSFPPKGKGSPRESSLSSSVADLFFFFCKMEKKKKKKKKSKPSSLGAKADLFIYLFFFFSNNLDTTPHCSRVVPHPSTKRAQTALTSVIGRERVHYGWCGRIQYTR